MRQNIIDKIRRYRQASSNNPMAAIVCGGFLDVSYLGSGVVGLTFECDQRGPIYMGMPLEALPPHIIDCILALHESRYDGVFAGNENLKYTARDNILSSITDVLTHVTNIVLLRLAKTGVISATAADKRLLRVARAANSNYASMPQYMGQLGTKRPYHGPLK
jgi:hypothetical protein